MRKKKAGPLLTQLVIGDMVAEGQCIARHEGRVVFVRDVAPQDVVDVQVKRTKKQFMEGVPVRFHQYSPLRTTPFCAHFGTCGGCKWQHVAYETQLFYKEKQVRDSLERIAKVPLPAIRPILPAPAGQHYRNKLEFTFSNKKWLTQEEIRSAEVVSDRAALGFHIPKRFDKILHIETCHLQPEPSNAIRRALHAFAQARGYTYFDLVEQHGLLRNLMIRTASTGQVMVLVIFYEPDHAAIEAIMTHLADCFPEITSLQYLINPKKNDSYFDQTPVCFRGTPYIEEAMENLRFRIGPQSFYQTNSQQAYALYQIVREWAALTGQEVVYDLYTGTGTIANFVARQARRVVGIESVTSAIEDARANAAHNGIANTSFFAGDMRQVLTADFLAAHGRPEVLITDPPRAGMHPDVVATIRAAAPRRIVYVSCNPATQARDLALLDEQYAVTHVQPVDMFPHTYHVENVVALVRREA